MVLFYLAKKPASTFLRLTNIFLLIAFSALAFTAYFPRKSYASALPYMPAADELIGVSCEYQRPLLRGIEVNREKPFRFELIIEEGSDDIRAEEFREECRRLVKYFLSALTIPKEDLWVNLSPYEGNSVVPAKLGKTEMGKDLLGQDYVLKQLLASLTYPESPLGKRFWKRIYQRAHTLFGKADIPINTFNKIWIVPEKALVYENGGKAFIKKARLKVMLEQDYLALKNNLDNPRIKTDTLGEKKTRDVNNFSSRIMKEMILPVIEEEINHGKNFAYLRQIYYSLILAVWFKKKLKESVVHSPQSKVDSKANTGGHVLEKLYVDKKKIKGVDVEDKEIKGKIYNQYLEAYKKGAYNYIKRDYDAPSQKYIQRRYYSGGFDGKNIESVLDIRPLSQSRMQEASDLLSSARKVAIELFPFSSARQPAGETKPQKAASSGTKINRIKKRILPFIFGVVIGLSPLIQAGQAAAGISGVVVQQEDKNKKIKSLAENVFSGKADSLKVIEELNWMANSGNSLARETLKKTRFHVVRDPSYSREEKEESVRGLIEWHNIEVLKSLKEDIEEIYRRNPSQAGVFGDVLKWLEADEQFFAGKKEISRLQNLPENKKQLKQALFSCLAAAAEIPFFGKKTQESIIFRIMMFADIKPSISAGGGANGLLEVNRGFLRELKENTKNGPEIFIATMLHEMGHIYMENKGIENKDFYRETLHELFAYLFALAVYQNEAKFEEAGLYLEFIKKHNVDLFKTKKGEPHTLATKWINELNQNTNWFYFLDAFEKKIKGLKDAGIEELEKTVKNTAADLLSSSSPLATGLKKSQKSFSSQRLFYSQIRRYIEQNKPDIIGFGERHYSRASSGEPCLEKFGRDILPFLVEAGYKDFIIEHLFEGIPGEEWEYVKKNKKLNSQMTPRFVLNAELVPGFEPFIIQAAGLDVSFYGCGNEKMGQEQMQGQAEEIINDTIQENIERLRNQGKKAVVYSGFGHSEIDAGKAGIDSRVNFGKKLFQQAGDRYLAVQLVEPNDAFFKLEMMGLQHRNGEFIKEAEEGQYKLFSYNSKDEHSIYAVYPEARKNKKSIEPTASSAVSAERNVFSKVASVFSRIWRKVVIMRKGKVFKELETDLTGIKISYEGRKWIINALSQSPTPKEAAESFIKLTGSLGRAGLPAGRIGLILISLSQVPDPKETAESFIKLTDSLCSAGLAANQIESILSDFSRESTHKETAESFIKLTGSLQSAGLAANWIDLILRELSQSSNPKETADNFITTGAVSAFKGLIDSLKSAGITDSYFEVEEIISNLSRTPNPKEAAKRLLCDNRIDFINTMLSFSGQVGLFAGLSVQLPDSWQDYIEAPELADVLLLDEFARENYRRNPEDMAEELFKPYLKNPEFVKVRHLIKQSRFDELKTYIDTHSISSDQIIEAYCLNNYNDIISQATELILGHKGTKGILENLAGLEEKIEITETTEDSLKSVLSQLELPSDGIEGVLNSLGYKAYNRTIVPIGFEVFLSAYRGSLEYDHKEANYLTHAITTAIVHYANKGGEARGDDETQPYGANAFHEFDLGLMMVLGKNNRAVDKNVSLAFHYEGDPLPEYARKRTLALKGQTLKDLIQKLIAWQAKEKAAKQTIHKLFNWITTGTLNKEELIPAIAAIKRELAVLKGECGLKESYFHAVFGFLDKEFFEALESDYVPSTDNESVLTRLLNQAAQNKQVTQVCARNGYQPVLVEHPWPAKRITLLDYLNNEAAVRKGTFEEEDLSSINIGALRESGGKEEFGFSSSREERLASSALKAVSEERIILSDGNKALKIADEHNNTRSVALRKDTDITLKKIMASIESSQDLTQTYRQNLLGVLSLLEHSPPAFLTFDAEIAGVFGKAFPAQKAIVIHQLLQSNLAALTHKILEYLVDSGELTLKLEGKGKKKNILALYFNGQKASFKLKGESLAEAKKNPESQEYLIRALRKQVFTQEQESLIKILYNRQFINNCKIIVEEAEIGIFEDEDWDRYIEILNVAKETLKNVSDKQFLNLLRRISGNPKLSLSRIGQIMRIRFFAQGGHKYVFKVSLFAESEEEPIEFLVALKKERDKSDIKDTELNNLKNLKGKGVPEFYFKLKSEDGRIVYAEEFIKGNTVKELAEQGMLSNSIRKNIISTLLSIAASLGGIVPEDIHGGNFIIKPGVDEAVMIDLGNKMFNIYGKHATAGSKLLFLGALFAQYGHIDKAKENNFIWDAFTENNDFPDGGGLRFLEEVNGFIQSMGNDNNINENKGKVLAEFFYNGTPYLFKPWGVNKNNFEPLISFSASFKASLSNYLEEYSESHMVNSSSLQSAAAEGRKTPAVKGGIDLNPQQMDLEIKGEGIIFPDTDIPFDIHNFQGFSFRITRIEPLQ